MIKAFKLVSAVLSLPIVWGTLKAFIKTISIFDPTLSNHKLFAAGLAAYPIFQTVFSQPLRTYVFGHELTHALASMLMGGKIKKFKVSAKGGSVQLSKSNFIISLAPYCVPLYTFFLIGLYWGISYFYPLKAYYGTFVFLVGFSISFHLSLTIFAVKQRQPDITNTGAFFSLIIIMLISPWIWALILKCIFYTQIDLSKFTAITCRYAGNAYVLIFMTIKKFIMSIAV
ncbi:MAG: hypothetical protein ABII23_01635 [bacterium]